jgi:hypothetical protein
MEQLLAGQPILWIDWILSRVVTGLARLLMMATLVGR